MRSGTGASWPRSTRVTRRVRSCERAVVARSASVAHGWQYPEGVPAEGAGGDQHSVGSEDGKHLGEGVVAGDVEDQGKVAVEVVDVMLAVVTCFVGSQPPHVVELGAAGRRGDVGAPETSQQHGEGSDPAGRAEDEDPGRSAAGTQVAVLVQRLQSSQPSQAERGGLRRRHRCRSERGAPLADQHQLSLSATAVQGHQFGQS